MQAPPTYAAGYAVGTVLAGRYRIEVVLAQRASSVVCLARDMMQSQQTVLIQSLPDLELASRVLLLRNLFQDAQIVDVLNRHDLVQILDFNVEPLSQTMFLVLAHRVGVPAEALVALGGPESKTAAMFVEMARGLLESHDDQFFQSNDKDTSPGVRLKDLPSRPPGPRSSQAPASAMRANPTNPSYPSIPPVAHPSYPSIPPVAHPSYPSIPPVANPSYASMPAPHAGPVYGHGAGAWQEAEDQLVRPAAPPAKRGSKLTRTHLAAIGLTTAILALALLIATADQPTYYGPKQIQRSGWHNYYGPRGEDFRNPGGLMDRADPRKRQITITSNPTGAMVYAGYKRLGVTPVTMDRPKKRKQLILRVSKTGYSDQTLVVSDGSPTTLTVVLGRSLSTTAPPTKRRSSGTLDDVGQLPSFKSGGPQKKKKDPNSIYDTSVGSDGFGSDGFR